MPLLVHWPGRVKPGLSDALMTQVDFLATFAALAGATPPAAAGPDSLNMLPALLGEAPQGRRFLVEHAGALIALRMGKWKYIPAFDRAIGSMYWNRAQRPANSPAELYDLDTDPSETANVAARFPEVVKRMDTLLEALRTNPKAQP